MSKLNTSNISWMVQRVKVMSFSEVFYRFKLELHKWWWKKRIPSYNVSLKSNISLKYPIQPQKNYPEQNKLIEEAEHYMVHHWLFFGLDCREEMIDWHKDPVSNLSAPITFGFSINHRNEHLVGNIKNIWEKNRHHHLTVLGMAFFLTREERYAKEIKDQLRSWIEQNPYLIGVNWTHPLEQGIRLIAWSYLFILLKGSQYFDEIFSKDGFLWKSVYEHQKFIIKTYSVGSSANNHLIGEMAGLFISTCYFPIFKESAKWKKFAQQKLEKELYRQTYVSGINKELAFSYQIFVIEFCLLTVIADNQAFSEKYRNILKNMLQFVDKVESTVGFLPNYGDGDEGMAVQLQSMDSSRSDWLFDLSNKFLRTSFSDRGSFLAQLFECRHAEAKPIQPSSYIYEDAGLLIYHDKNANHSYAGLFDFGPLGMRGLAAHGHADALSFTLAIDKQPFIIDPGTYCYHTDLYWREYFRSVHAHNALSIYGQDQSTQAGPFLWSRKANAKLLSFDLNKKKIKATEDGYSSLGVGHIREFTWGDGRIEIRDELIGGGKYQLDIRFHFHPDVEINFDKILVICQMGIIKVIIKPDESLHAKLIAGSDDGGWYSPKFGIKNRTNTLVLNGVISLPASISNKIILE